MKFIFAFVIIVGFTFIVNFIMMRLFKRLNTKTNLKGEDLLLVELKNELEPELKEFRETIEEFLTKAKSILAQIEEKEKNLSNLLRIVDKKINELQNLQNSSSLEEDRDIQQEDSYFISQLYKQGLSKVEIARKLGIGIGEVELRLGLFGKKDNL